jgi:SAM-dependent methyltransferase
MTRSFGFSDPGEHAFMLLDEVRTAAFARAIAAVVRPDDVVLDIGTGTGLLALLAARAGARRVYAIERTGMVELAREHVRDNGVESIVQVIRCDLEQLAQDGLPEPPTVLISEVLGHFAPAEGQHHLFRIARRLATPDARLIPSSYRIVFAAAELGELERGLVALRNVRGLSLRGLERRLRSRTVLTQVWAAELLGLETPGVDIAVDAELPHSFGAELRVEHDGQMNALVASFEARLAPGIELRTTIDALPSHWAQLVFPIDPLPCKAGDVLQVSVQPRLVTDRGTYRWRVVRGSDVREGDALASVVGDKADLLEQLGVRLKGARPRPTLALQAWAAALGGRSDDSIPDMASRLLAAYPDRYADQADAEQEVLALLRAAGAL